MVGTYLAPESVEEVEWSGVREDTHIYELALQLSQDPAKRNLVAEAFSKQHRSEYVVHQRFRCWGEECPFP